MAAFPDVKLLSRRLLGSGPWGICLRCTSCIKPIQTCGLQRNKRSPPTPQGMLNKFESSPLKERESENADLVGQLGGEWMPMLALVGFVSYFQVLDPAIAATDSLVSGKEVIHSHQVFSLAEGEDFWANMASYARFFVSVMVGTGYVMVKPVMGLLKRPQTAILVVIGVALAYFGLRATIEAMLGLTDYQYTAASFVT